MIDFERARRAMVDNQLRAGGVTERRLLAAMASVPREIFLPESRRAIAYVDDVHELGAPGSGRFLASPATFARLVQLAEIAETDRVLDVGTGTGYPAAVLAKLARSVTGLEADPALAELARANLAALGIGNVEIVAGEAEALPGGGYDAIVVEGSIPGEPGAFLPLLSPGGRLVAVVCEGGVGVARVYVRAETGVASRLEFNAALPPLRRTPPRETFVF